MRIVIIVLLISTISSEIKDIKKAIFNTYDPILYLINRPAYNCLYSLNYQPSTLKKINNEWVTVQGLVDLALRDLNETSSHNLRLLNGYGWSPEEVSSNCENCAERATFKIDLTLEKHIMYKFFLVGNPDTLKVYDDYKDNPNKGRKEMCHLRYLYPKIIIIVKLNEDELQYIDQLCNNDD